MRVSTKITTTCVSLVIALAISANAQSNQVASSSSSSTSSAPAAVPSPPGENCTLHGDHYHCDDEHGEEEGHAHEEGEEHDHDHGEGSETAGSNTCVIHVGHHHGDCTEEQLQQCDTTEIGEYDQGLHIGAIFILLATSALGVMIPLLSGRLGNNPNSMAKTVMSKVFFIAKHFGTGILLSTALIHLLNHGFIMFANKCIGNLEYEATAAAIALAGAFVTFLLDFFATRHLAHHHSHSTYTTSEGESSYVTSPGGEKEINNHDGVVTDQNRFLELGHGHAHHIPSDRDKKWQVILLEAGIIFHSIMIGVTLGATGGSGWIRLLIVIVFHQFFEGLALGARITLLQFAKWWQPAIMGVSFSLITPIGIAIGVGVHKGFEANGRAALLAVGILNSISAGILLYTAFQLLASDFTSGSLKTAPLGKVMVALTAMVIGMICMSVLGKWA